MIPAYSPFLALRYLLTRPIVLLGILGVTFAVWAMLLVDAVFTGFVEEIREDVRCSAAPLLVTDLPHDTGYAALQAAIEQDPDVGPGHTAPRLRHYGLLQTRRTQRPVVSGEVEWNPMDGGFALLLGIDPSRELAVSQLADWLPRASARFREKGLPLPPSTVLAETEASRRDLLQLPDAVEWEARRSAGLPHPTDPRRFRSEWPGVLLSWRRAFQGLLRPGEPVTLVSAVTESTGPAGARLVPTKTPLAFAGWFATGHRQFDETTAILPIETLRTQLGHDLHDPGSIDLVTDVAVRPRDGLQSEQLAACQRRLQAAVQALLPAGSPPCSVLDWEEQNVVFLAAVEHEHRMMQFVLFVVMLVAAFVIYATLHMMVVQKWKDIGILAALGGAPGGIGLVFLACGAVTGALGATLGAGLGTASAVWLNPFDDWLSRTWQVSLFPKDLFDLPRIPCRLDPAWVVQVAVGACVLAVLVSIVPARKAARMNPVKALSYE